MTAAVAPAQQPVMEGQGLVLRPDAAPFDIELQPGVVLGLAGLEGHGQVALLEVLCGLRLPHAGTLMMDGGATGARGLRNLHDAARRGIAYLPRDRKTEGILPSLSVLENFAIATLPRDSRLGVLRPRSIRRRYRDLARRLDIVTSSPDASIRTLSGGNQQKVLLARWLATEPRVLLLNDSSRGVDHRTRVSLHAIYRDLADRGTSVVLLSSEIEELLLVADAVVVLRDFTISARLTGAELERAQILTAMFGGARHARGS